MQYFYTKKVDQAVKICFFNKLVKRIHNSYAIYVLKGNKYTENIKIIQINLIYEQKDKKKIKTYQVRDQNNKEI